METTPETTGGIPDAFTRVAGEALTALAHHLAAGEVVGSVLYRDVDGRCAAWARYVTGSKDPSYVAQGITVLDDLRDYMRVERALLRIGKATHRKTDRMRRLLIWVYHEGRQVGEFRTYEVGRGHPFELLELGISEEAVNTLALENFYGLLTSVVASEDGLSQVGETSVQPETEGN